MPLPLTYLSAISDGRYVTACHLMVDRTFRYKMRARSQSIGPTAAAPAGPARLDENHSKPPLPQSDNDTEG